MPSKLPIGTLRLRGLHYFTLCTIPDPISALREVERVLKPEGRFTFSSMGAATYRP
ncbi:MAG: methyltransferase domain-containing protein [Nitrospiraceae bacterium]